MKSEALIPDYIPALLPLCVNSSMNIFFIMLWSLFCWCIINKATGTGFAFLLSLNSDCTYFITYIFCIITDLANNKRSNQYIFQRYVSSLLHVLRMLCLLHPFFNYRFKDSNYSSLSHESSVHFWNHFLSQWGQNIKGKLRVKKGRATPENEVFAPLREQCVTLEHLLVNLP